LVQCLQSSTTWGHELRISDSVSDGQLYTTIHWFHPRWIFSSVAQSYHFLFTAFNSSSLFFGQHPLFSLTLQTFVLRPQPLSHCFPHTDSFLGNPLSYWTPNGPPFSCPLVFSPAAFSGMCGFILEPGWGVQAVIFFQSFEDLQSGSPLLFLRLSRFHSCRFRGDIPISEHLIWSPQMSLRSFPWLYSLLPIMEHYHLRFLGHFPSIQQPLLWVY
jgi:hypothetical protein